MKSILVSFIFAFIFSFAHGQNLKGKLTDYTAFPIPAAEIVNLRTGLHSHSNEKGHFELRPTMKGDTIKIIRIGYQSLSHVINDPSEYLTLEMEESSITLKEVTISPSPNAITILSDIDTRINPVKSSQEILQKVPGLFIGQHAGGGKAEQIFLRGFDLDHGTDIRLNVDGLPVNMVSHAHGQGYSDLHFIIPETLDNIDFGKGPYYAEKGDFTTAGYVDFNTKNTLESSLISFETGQFETFRTLGMFKILNTSKHQSFIATEYIRSNGPFESPQNFRRNNVFGKYNVFITPNDRLGLTLSHFKSNWDASGQIPNRSVEDGSISRFGYIDDTEGGNTSRTNIILDYDKQVSDISYISNKLYFSHYDFELYSNFTFFLEDPINGDQIRQKENRNIYGFSSTLNHNLNLGNSKLQLKAGIDLRVDEIANNELSHTKDRKTTLDRIQLGDIYQSNLGGFFDLNFEMGKWLVNPSLRLDHFDFQYDDALLPNFDKRKVSQGILSPKLNILYNYARSLQFYLKMGAGFHSNDSRVVTVQNGKEVLPAAYGTDLGFLWKPNDKILVNAASWALFLDQEFVYVGDAGIVEPSGKTRRLGLDLSLRYQPYPWMFTNWDLSYSYARSLEEESRENLIPLAPNFTATGGFNIIHPSGFFGGIQMRHIADRAANEDNSIVALGYTIFDLNLGYEYKSFTLGFQVLNLLDTEWNEAQFATESRLRNELNSVEELHFTPGAPLHIKGSIQYRF